MSDISWGYVVGCATTSNSVVKTGVLAGFNCCAISSRFIKGDGYVEYTVTDLTTNRMVGLAVSTANLATYYDINYSIQHTTSYMNVYELNSKVYSSIVGFVVVGDVIRINKTGTTVTYLKNGVLFYTSLTASSTPLLLKVSIYTINGTANCLKMEGAAAEVLRVKDQAVLFDGKVGNLPAYGARTAMMWTPDKPSLRVGMTGTSWDVIGPHSYSFGTDSAAYTANHAFIQGVNNITVGASSVPYVSALNGYPWMRKAYAVASFGQGGLFAGNTSGVDSAHLRNFAIANEATPTLLRVNGVDATWDTGQVVLINSTVDCIVSGIARCITGSDAGTSASWTMFGTVERTGVTTRFVGSPFNLLFAGTLSKITFTPKCATADDAGLLTMTLVPAAVDATDDLQFTFTGHASSTAVPNVWHAAATIYMLSVT